MKDASAIINSIQNKPQFSKLSNYKCIKTIQSMFVLPVQKMVSFTYIKNKTLFFVFNHPVGKQEFDNNIQSIKSALNFHRPEECDEDLFTDIKAFVTHKPKKEQIIVKKEKLLYKERASGDIQINIKDEKLNTLVKSIQDIIKAKNDK